jgi:glutathione peroxidase
MTQKKQSLTFAIIHFVLAPYLASSELAFSNSSKPEQAMAPDQKFDFGVHQFVVNDIKGKPINLKTYQGKVLLIVNTASQCGYTNQYKGLQKIYTTYKDKGFEILGFPSNDFGGQEPGSNKDIKNFCELKYKVTFPMFSKLTVLGKGQSALFKYLTVDSRREFKGPIDWNFEKFLIGPQGTLEARFKSSTDPENPELTAKIEALLAAKNKSKLRGESLHNGPTR